ncbi:hypothetical protein BE08_04510 [Sorangium cellulosum]|uniref:Uncharacterized protein n=1 Tax=Sorangium cellulosum TaxID=56 RepID=A0A150PCL0_SORCE|nr:hypothetical protein BE08_04510 [Sorangium cellulosum]
MARGARTHPVRAGAVDAEAVIAQAVIAQAVIAQAVIAQAECTPQATSPWARLHLFAAVLELPMLRRCLPNPSSRPGSGRRPARPEVRLGEVARPPLLLSRRS